MAAQRPGKLSPYEVMSGGLRTSTTQADDTNDPPESTDTPQVKQEQPVTPTSGPENNKPKAASPQAPIVLRLPRGYVVLMAIAMVGILILAHWTGYRRGYASAIQVTPATQPPAGSFERVPPFIRSPGLSPLAPEIESGDGREIGLNYFVLAHYPLAARQEASELVQFLAEQGVSARAYRRESGKFYQVVALHGYSKEQISSPQRRAHEKQLRQLGRKWKSRGLGPDFAQSGIYLDRYEGTAAVEVITGTDTP